MFYVYPIVTPDEAQKIVNQLMQLKWEQGKARTPELTGTVKQNLELLPTDKLPVVKAIGKHLTKRILQDEAIQTTHMITKARDFKFNQYTGGGTYHRHTDSPRMVDVRTDFACTLFLSDPDSYDGGELVLDTPMGERSIKGKQGEAVIYECGQPHTVMPVTRGTRIAGITWLQSCVRSAKQREILQDIHRLAREIEAKMLASDMDEGLRKWHVDIAKIQGNLSREWIS